MRDLNPNLLTFDCLLFFHRFQVHFSTYQGYPDSTPFPCCAYLLVNRPKLSVER